MVASAMPKRRPSLQDSSVLLGLESSLLRSLLAVVDTGSFVGAARVVHRTPSAISMQMKKLELQLGQPIFAHQGRSVALTPSGEVLLTYARRVAEIAEEAMTRFDRLSYRSKVRLGMPEDYAAVFLPSMLSGLTAAQPRMEIEVTCHASVGLFAMLEIGEIDVAFVTSGCGTDGVVQSDGPIYHDRLAWAGLSTGSAHLQRPLPIAIAPLTCPWRKAAIDALDAAGISYRIVYTGINFAGQIASIFTGHAVAPLPLVSLPPGISAFGEEYGLPRIGACSLELRRSPHASGEFVSAAMDHIRAHFQSRNLA